MPTVPTTRSLRRVRSRAFAIEAALLKASVGGLVADRQQCRSCRRSPLVGERVYLYGGKHEPELVCALCRPGHKGEPLTSQVVRSPEGGSVTRMRPREE